MTNPNWEIPRFISDGDPLLFKSRLDIHSDRNTIECIYQPGLMPAPKGLGRWPILGDKYELPLQPDKWIQTPEKGEALVVKIAEPLNDNERLAMLRLNSFLGPNQEARHAFLYGYGWDYENSKNPEEAYLVIEKVPERFTPFPELVTKGFEDKRDGHGLLLSMASFLSKIHFNGVAHGDLGGPGLGHAFWETGSKELRVIDWNNSRIADSAPSSAEGASFRDTISLDQEVLWELVRMLFLNTTKNTEVSNLAKDMYPEPIASKIQEMYQKHNNIGRRSYSSTPTGTRNFERDIRSLTREF